MTTKKIPQYGDPEILPKGVVRRPSAERQIFDNRGRLKTEPGPYSEERFYEAPDLKDIPQWVRKRGEEWTTADFRLTVFSWLIGFFNKHEWARKWDVVEVGSAVRSGRLPIDHQHLVIGITSDAGLRREVAVAFPEASRDAPAVLSILRSAEVSLEALHASQ